MDLSLNWIKEYVDLQNVDPQDLAQRLTFLGLEVEGIRYLSEGSNLTIGEVKTCIDHPDSDHLHICEVDIKDQLATIVCGAPNVAVGQKVIVALPGAVLKDNFKIKQSTIRGVESNGMICSLLELGIDPHFLTDEQKKGIEVLSDDAPIGHPSPLSYLKLDDIIFEINITPNRADCLSMYALAHEVAAIYNLEIKPLETKCTVNCDLAITPVIEDDTTTFGLRVIDDIEIKPSPKWLQHELMAVGIQPINNIVDISNYIMIEMGQPIHMYDFDKIQGHSLIARKATESEIKLLDGEIYSIKETDLLIADESGALGLAGVMGGYSTMIDEHTKRIVVEAATFDAVTIRNTARRLNLLTDASMRFIKGTVNPYSTHQALDRIAYLVQESLPNAKVGEIKIANECIYKPHIIEISLSKIQNVLGFMLKTSEIEDALMRLKFVYDIELINDEPYFKVEVPSYRKDLVIQEDIIEEIIRIHGYEALPKTLPISRVNQYGFTLSQRRLRQVKKMMSHFKFNETINYSLVSEETITDFNVLMNGDVVKLMSPLSKDHALLRQSLIPSLLEVVQYNQTRQMKDVHIYEVSNVYAKGIEKQLLSAVSVGIYDQLRWQHQSTKTDFYLLKGMVEALFQNLGINQSRYCFKRFIEDQKNYHPGKSAAIYIGKDRIGIIGEIHPLMAKKYGVKDAYLMELDLTYLLSMNTQSIKYQPIPVYPSINRDLSLMVNQKIAVGELIQSIQKSGRPLVKEVSVFDIYEGDLVTLNLKSVALSIQFQDDQKTLTNETVDGVIEKILKALESDYQAVLRS